MKPNVITGKCPVCKHTHNPINADPIFAGGAFTDPAHVWAFALCKDCKWRFDLASDKERTKMLNQACINLKQSDHAVKYTVTTGLALQIHGTFHRAWVHGVEAPPLIIAAIEAGIVDAYTVLGEEMQGTVHAE